MKLNGHVARLALLFQVMKWATDSGDMQYVELDSVDVYKRQEVGKEELGGAYTHSSKSGVTHFMCDN